MKILVALYAHPEGYPPTLNAVMECAQRVDKVVLICRQLLPTNWIFPKNVEMIFTTRFIGLFELEKISAFSKIKQFIDFTRTIWRRVINDDVDLIIAYDPIPLFACGLVRLITGGKFIFWYHNHDTSNILSTGRFSVGGLAAILEPFLFKYLDAFSFPAKERKKYFPLKKWKGKLYFIPNYPPKNLYGKIKPKSKLSPTEIRMIYQGSLGRNHGFEEIIPFLSKKISGRKLSLTLMGKIKPEYKDELMKLSVQYNNADKLHFIDFLPYHQVCEKLPDFDVGLATHKPIGITYSTGGTASNKIYEYAAAGLPVVLFENQHYREHLGRRSWTEFTNLEWSSFKNCLTRIIENYTEMARTARTDFMEYFNFENQFSQVIDDILNITLHQHFRSEATNY